MPLLEILKSSGAGNARKKILILGSGGLSIGQAGEFDYSGTQAIKSVVEQGLDAVVINPNIATVQTNPSPQVKVYLYPVTPEWVEKVIKQERPQGIMAAFGGQTALNCLVALDKKGILAEYGVENLATCVRSLEVSEDRDLFAAQMRKIAIPVPPSIACNTIEEARKAAEEIGYPVIIRAAYALGGLGSGFADNEDELNKLARPALSLAPQILVEKSLKGWKEVEYEVMRDRQGNTITICNMENFDPLGIHTGDSIVVCPSQSLSDDEYQILRNASIKIINSLDVVGECNAQFALSPDSLDFYVIEVNARLSRSSALASKSTGYPIAYIAAKVMLGFDLLEIRNPVTGVTCAFTEPALDYITVKIPRWDLTKFQGVSRSLGSTMKSVGEVMAIGRNFPEALQKAVRMVTELGSGLSHEFTTQHSLEQLWGAIQNPTDTRLFSVMACLRRGIAINEIHEKSRIDKWFLNQLKVIVDLENLLVKESESSAVANIDDVVHYVFDHYTAEKWLRFKLLGFSDEQLASICLASRFKEAFSWSDALIKKASLVIRALRKDKGVTPVVKKIDTTAGEYPSPSNYLYLTYGGTVHDELTPLPPKPTAIILGCGPYRIGTSVEFDWCAVGASQTLRKNSWNSVIINCNPETVSTDYNTSDKLYFEEISLERVLDIYELESPQGIIASMGGQTPNKLVISLAEAGVKLLGHSPASVDGAEDRNKFSALLDQLGISQPRWINAVNKDEIEDFTNLVGFPVLVRPSYVLSGAAMRVAYDKVSLANFLDAAAKISSDHPVVISEFVEGAREIELDGVAHNGKIICSVVGEHVENAGVHSGDATVVVPAQKLYVETVRQLKKAASAIVKGLDLNGPFNMQFLARSNHIMVIECNARAARTFPFVSKVTGLDFASVATQVMMGRSPGIISRKEDELPHVGVKAAMFSFTRLPGVDPILGVEMASTGEVGCIGQNFEEALLLALESTHIVGPKKGLLVSAGPEAAKLKFVPVAKSLQKNNVPIYATPGTAAFFEEHGVAVVSVGWPDEPGLNVMELIRSGKVDFVINIPKNSKRRELTAGMQIRQTAINYGCSLMTNMEKVLSFFSALENTSAKHYGEGLISLPPMI